MREVVLAMLCLGLTGFGFHYDSGWAFAGAVLAFLSLLD